MLNKQTRQSLNDTIQTIKFYDKELDALVKSEHLVDRELFEDMYERAYHELNKAIEEFSLLVDTIWYNNMDVRVQKSLNYYIKKSGLTQRKITAII